MAELSQPTKNLISRYQFWYQSLQPKEGVSTIHVDEVASAVASFYEKIRGVVDWKEEHLLRKAAIERILKRRLFLQKNGAEIAAPLVSELIRGGHFPNDRIEERCIEEIQKLIDKYLFILNFSPPPPIEKLKIQLYDWLISIAACEVEEVLDPPHRERALIEYMEELMRERITLPTGISELEKETQISIAVQKALFKLDKPIISYHLLKKRYSEWLNLPKPLIEEVTKNIYSIWDEIEKDLKHPLAEKFYQICERYDTLYLILGDIIARNPSQAPENLSGPEVLENLIRESYQKRLLKLRARVSRAAIYTTISIFVTKMLLAFAIEVPFDKYVTGEFNYQTLGFNILIPPLLMFFLVLTIRPPRKENLQQVIMEVMKIVYQKEKKDIYPIKSAKKRGFILNAIITIFYLLTFVISFGLIIWGLNKLNFGVLSMIIFLMFFCLISFAGVKIRERSKELQVLPEKTGFLTFLIDSFSLPFIRMGKWLSGQLAKYNIVIVLITALIDMPFQLFTEFLEHWRFFLKEKKEEIH